jgi:hypothetical protein
MPRQHKIEMPDYSVIVAIEDDDSVALDISAHPDIAEDLGNAVMKLLESDAGTPIVEACRHPNDQHLQDAAKKLLEKAIRIVPPDVENETGDGEDQME